MEAELRPHYPGAAGDWDVVRPFITDMYVNQGMRLTDIQQEIERVFLFKAK